MAFTYICDECGKVFRRRHQIRPGQAHKFCDMACTAAFVEKNQTGLAYAEEHAGRVPHDMVTIQITMPIDVFPELMPEVGARYAAERYKNISKKLRYGYVIRVRGKRINVRPEECIEI